MFQINNVYIKNRVTEVTLFKIKYFKAIMLVPSLLSTQPKHQYHRG
jgi:hypothetical protein